jgi:hypothetical protein
MEPSSCKSVSLSRRRQTGIRHLLSAAMLALAALASTPNTARADFGGIGFWLPGLMGSLAAVPGQPGWSWMTLYVHLSQDGGGGRTFQLGGAFVAGLKARADFVASGPSYTFETPVFGGRASVALFGAYGSARADISATLTGPLGNAISGTRSDSLTSFTDVFWQGAIKWNQGVNNYMVYGTGNFPVAEFDPARLVNLGFGHWSLDGGVGYTYLNPETGYEFSVVVGLTYNWVNPKIDYKNGIDSHLDWGASKFIAKDWHIGVVGFAFQQLTGDSGSGARLGDFKGRTFGIGPQVGHMFPLWEGYTGYANLKGYKEFGVENRAEGYSVWFTLVFQPAAPETTPTPTTRRIMK